MTCGQWGDGEVISGEEQWMREAWLEGLGVKENWTQCGAGEGLGR